MDASDIVKKKQRCTLYQAPTSTTVHSTVYTISSINGGTTSYGSTLQTCSTSCRPTFLTYEEAANARPVLSFTEQWKAEDPTMIYQYKSLYGGLSTTSTVTVTSTLVLLGPGPFLS